MHPMLNIAVRAARNAGRIIMRYLERVDTLTVESKQRHDFVTEVDHAAEEQIVATLRKSYPDHGILAEESGTRSGRDEYRWIVDPLDGTTNYVHGFPQFAVSIALEHKGELTQAVVYDPVHEEMFTASRGQGAQLNDRRLRVSRTRSLDDALLGTGFPFRDYTYIDPYLAMFREMLGRTSGVRRPGSAALDLAYVAAGRLDGFWEIGLHPWDMAAGLVLIREAGGLATDFRGEHQAVSRGEIVAGNPYIYQHLLDAVQRHFPHTTQ